MTTTPITKSRSNLQIIQIYMYIYRHGMCRNVASYNEKGTWLPYNTSGIMDVIKLKSFILYLEYYK